MKDINAAEGQDIITQLDFRGDRIFLPILATKISKLTEKDEVCLTIAKNEIKIKKFC